MRIMIDIEALGEAIVQIGAVDIDTEDEFFVNIDFKSAMNHGSVLPSTLEWWMKQPDDARLGLFTNPVVSAREAAELLTMFCRQDNKKASELWCHATYDAVMLDRWYKSMSKTVPWHWRNVRDLRTLFALHPPAAVKRQGPHHHALWDAKFQRDQLLTTPAA